jgi:hypothetical protein
MVPLTVGQVHCRLWHGLVPAVPVPCSASGEIDLAAQRAYVAWMAEQPIAGVAVWVHTGRGLHLKREQRLQVLGSWCEGLGANKLIIAGVGGSPERAADFSDYVARTLSWFIRPGCSTMREILEKRFLPTTAKLPRPAYRNFSSIFTRRRGALRTPTSNCAN